MIIYLKENLNWINKINIKYQFTSSSTFSSIVGYELLKCQMSNLRKSESKWTSQAARPLYCSWSILGANNDRCCGHYMNNTEYGI